jgi:hypothetical protein
MKIIKKKKGLQRKLEVLYPNRTLLAQTSYYLLVLIKKVFTLTIYAGISEINSKNFINIGQEINLGQFFEKNVCLYEIYSKIF